MTQKAITIKDLAEKLNISVSTVSRALKDNPEISQQTRKTVQALAKELGYKPNPIAVALKTHKSNTIGVVVPQIVNTFFATVVKKIEDVADKYGYNVLVASSNETFEKEKKNIDIFLANRCDGIILSISKATTSYEHIKQIQDMGVPLVLFDRTAKVLDVSKVVADDADAAFKIVQHLIHGGARRIALLTGPEQLSIGKNRMKGYLKAMTLNKLEINTDYIVRCEDFSVKAAKEATQRLLNMKNMPDAIFGINDDMAIGAIEAIKEKGLKIPEEVAVFGFSNSKRSRYMTPSVSTINQFPEKIGETAAELLFEQILDAKHAQIREEVINSELIVRESSDRRYSPNQQSDWGNKFPFFYSPFKQYPANRLFLISNPVPSKVFLNSDTRFRSALSLESKSIAFPQIPAYNSSIFTTVPIFRHNNFKRQASFDFR